MQFSRLLISLAIAIFFEFGVPAGQSQNGVPTATQENGATQTAGLKAIDQPMAPYPLEAVRRGIEGKSIVVDANGKVSQAKALSGPKELFPAALASVKMWQYEPPVSAPVTMTVEIGYGVPKECPGPIDRIGRIGIVAVVNDGNKFSRGARFPPLLPCQIRDGHVKEAHVIKSLSPGLDKAAVDGAPVEIQGLFGSFLPSLRSSNNYSLLGSRSRHCYAIKSGVGVA